MILSYCRKSTDSQNEIGLREQERKNHAFAHMANTQAFDFANYVDDGVSGSIPLGERAAGSLLLADARAGDTIVAAKLDRMFRSALDALQTVKALKDRKIDLVLLDIGAEPVTADAGLGKILFGMMALFADLERERIAERMTEGRAAKARNGGHIGGRAPYGSRIEGRGRQARLAPNEGEVAILEIVKKMGPVDNVYRIKRELDRRGIVGRSGKKLHMTQVKRLFNRYFAVEMCDLGLPPASDLSPYKIDPYNYKSVVK